MNHSNSIDHSARIDPFQEALELSSDGILLYEAVRGAGGEILDYKLTALNEAAASLFAMTREAAAGQLISILWPGIREDEIWQHAAAVVTLRSTYRSQLRRRTPAGDELWFDLTLRPYKDGFVNSFRDITPIKEAQEQSARQEAFYEELMDQSISRQAVLLPLWDDAGELTDFRYEYLNYGAGREDHHRHLPMYQSPPAPGMTLKELVPSVMSNPVWDFYCGIAKTGVAARTEVEYAADGIYALVDVAGKRLEDGRILIAYSDISHTRRIASELAREKSWLTGVLDTVPLGITVFEAVRDKSGELKDLRLVRRNEKVLELSRIPEERYKPGALLSELMPPELFDQFEVMLNVLRTGEPLLHELYQPNRDIWISSRVIKYGDGLLSTIQDITENKRHGGEMQRQAELLNAVLDVSPLSIVVYQAMRNSAGDIEDFRAILANKQALEISGYSAEEFLSTTFFQRTPGAEERLLPQLSAALKAQSPRTFEHYVPSSGRWVNSITTPFGDGFIATSQDITEQKLQHRIIEEQAELFNGVLSSLQNGLTIFRIIRDESGGLADLEYIQIADSVERDTGIKREDMIGRRLRDRIPEIQGTDHWKAISEMVRTGQPQHFETHFTLGGYDNYLLNWISPLGSDKLVSVYYIINDLKRAQRELEHTITELRRSNDDLEQFASIASHDLQEPLRKVQSFGNMLEARYAASLGEDGKDLVRRMQGAAGRMRDLVTGLLDFASLSRGKNERAQAVDTQSLIKEIIADLDHTFDRAEGRVELVDDIPHVLGIPGHLRHLFHNLLTNAVKFRQPGKPPLVTIRAVPLKDSDAARLAPAARPDRYVRLDIEDNGIGFDPQYADKIFGLFERLHGVSEYKGTGIGLSICRRVAERHDGAIWAEGRPGAGSTFFLLLPKAEE